MTLQKAQVLALLPKFTGALSMLGSGFIILDIFQNKKTRRRLSCSDSQDRTFRQIMLGLSCMDLLCSVCNVLSTWPTPSDQGNKIWLASGNTQTCTAQGFFAELGNVGAVLYSASLSIYYVFKISGGARQGLPKWQRVLLHAIPIGTAMAMAIVGLPLTLYNNSGWLCWYAPYPAGCDKTNPTSCTRGTLAGTFRWVHYGIVWSAIFAVTVCMFLIFKSVRKTEKQAERWSFHNSIRSFGTAERPPPPTTTEPEPEAVPFHSPESAVNSNQSGHLSLSNMSEPKSITFAMDTNFSASQHLSYEGRSSMRSETSTTSRTQWVATQAVLYIGGLYLTWFFTTLTRIFQTVQGVSHYELLVLMALFFPLQGFFNALIYSRSQYMGVNNRSGRQSSRRSLSTTRLLNSLRTFSRLEGGPNKKSQKEADETQPNTANGLVDSRSTRGSPPTTEGGIISIEELQDDPEGNEGQALQEDKA